MLQLSAGYYKTSYQHAGCAASIMNVSDRNVSAVSSKVPTDVCLFSHFGGSSGGT